MDTSENQFQELLGFTSDSGDEHYAVVWRDNSAIHFVKADDRPSGLHLFQWIRDVDAYHQDVRARGAEILLEPSNTPYGARTFNVRDPHGLVIIFSQEIDAVQAVQLDRA